MAKTETVRRLSPEDVAYITHRRDAAQWYAWGRLDEMHEHDDTTALRIDDGADLLPYTMAGGTAATFAEMCRREAAMYRMEETGSLASITDQWRRFLADCGEPAEVDT